MRPARLRRGPREASLTTGESAGLDHHPESTSSGLPLAPGILPDMATVNAAGHLVLGGCDAVDLAARFGTPLYVFDEGTIRARARAFRNGLRTAYAGPSLVCYASKAFSAPWLLRIIAEEGLGVDVVSGGELYVALHAGFPAERIYFHGNNKSEDELRFALARGISRVVVDNLDELPRLARLARVRGVRQPILLRVTPGVEAHTHEYIQTGATDSKFGLSIETGMAEEGVRAALAESSLELMGFHAHIGSQIFDVEPYRESVWRVVRFAAAMRDRHGVELRELSPGGGFGTRYTETDDPPLPNAVMHAVGQAVTDAATAHGFAARLPLVTIEPGRALVAAAGVALYTVGSVKEIQGVRTYVAVDGGMADNIRPATYQAVYSSLLANRAGERPTSTVAIAGKYCETGDVLVREAWLPWPRVGDLVALPGAGAYTLAMASNYNLALKPPVVVVADGEPRLVRRRETYEDLVRTELTETPPGEPG